MDPPEVVHQVLLRVYLPHVPGVRMAIDDNLTTAVEPKRESIVKDGISWFSAEIIYDPIYLF